MPITKEIPNKSLEGHELKIFACYVFHQACEERLGPLANAAVNALQFALDNDCFFRPATLYPGVSFQIEVKREGEEIRIKPIFNFPNMPSYSHHEPFVKPVTVTSEWRDGSGQFGVVAKVDNPNLVRIKLGMPIYKTKVDPPGPGEYFARMSQVPVEYDASEYPELPAPIVFDLGKPIPQPVAPVPMRHKLYSPTEMHGLDLDAPPNPQPAPIMPVEPMRIAEDMMSNARVAPPPENMVVTPGEGKSFVHPMTENLIALQSVVAAISEDHAKATDPGHPKSKRKSK